MNSDDHLTKMESDPPQGDGQRPMRVGTHLLQRPKIPDESLPTQAEQEMDEDEEEEAKEHEPEGSSRPKRSRPVGRPSGDSQMADIASGIQQLQLGQDNQCEFMRQWRQENQLWMACQESRLEACETRIEHLQAQGMPDRLRRKPSTRLIMRGFNLHLSRGNPHQRQISHH